MTYLPDVNVWLALVSPRHVHSRAAADWLNHEQKAQALFCRVTQMSLLRLLTNQAVMHNDVLSCAKAWQVYERLREDQRISFATEPPGVELEWRKLTSSRKPQTNLWTDAYLAAFVRVLGVQLVTFDRGATKLADSVLLSDA